MKALIIYASKYGATKTIAEKIATYFDGAVLTEIDSVDNISIDDFDCIILGSRLTAGQVNKKLKKYAANNSGKLLSKKLGIFVSGLQNEGGDEYFKQNFSQELLDKAAAKAFLAGVFDPDKCGFAERKIIKAVAKLDTYTSLIDDAEIEAFAKNMLS